MATAARRLRGRAEDSSSPSRSSSSSCPHSSRTSAIPRSRRVRSRSHRSAGRWPRLLHGRDIHRWSVRRQMMLGLHAARSGAGHLRVPRRAGRGRAARRRHPRRADEHAADDALRRVGDGTRQRAREGARLRGARTGVLHRRLRRRAARRGAHGTGSRCRGGVGRRARLCGRARSPASLRLRSSDGTSRSARSPSRAGAAAAMRRTGRAAPA